MTELGDGPNKAALAVAHIFQVHDTDWSDRLIELLRDADMEDFRVMLLAEHQRRLDEFLAWEQAARRGPDGH